MNPAVTIWAQAVNQPRGVPGVSEWPSARVAVTARPFGWQSSWPAAAVAVEANAPETATDNPSAWPVASVAVEANAPASATAHVSAWPVAEAAVEAFAPTVATGSVSAWPLADVAIESYVPTAVSSHVSSWPAASVATEAYAWTSVTGGGGYDPASNADFYFEVGRSGQEMWEELTGQTTPTTNGNVAGEIENIGLSGINAFAHASGTRGTLNTTSGLLELTDGTDSYNYNPGAVPSGCTIAWVGDLDEASDAFPDRIASISIPGTSDVDSNGTFSVEHTFTAGTYNVVESYSALGTAFAPTSGWGALPFIVTWEFGAGGAYEVYSDNSLLDNDTHTSAISGAATDLDIGILSANAASGGYAPVDLKAFAYFDYVVDSTERGNLNTYLAAL